jgi:hypothetical protein
MSECGSGEVSRRREKSEGRKSTTTRAQLRRCRSGVPESWCAKNLAIRMIFHEAV